MFHKCGEMIKKLALVLFWLNFILLTIWFIVGCVVINNIDITKDYIEGSIEWYYKSRFVVAAGLSLNFIVTYAASVFGVWVSNLLLYGFGIIVDNYKDNFYPDDYIDYTELS